ncbi:hypothetical protein CFR73_02085 [Novacetimonas maltaceti]|uniref:DUF937 domain-containing protein n=1 Tax=Novacetimonas maltaceti TaxID=1203393 RepID=A0A2S3W4M0_9PROT|nr:hypothetical protein [Novacetimonas maltaceti]POF63822.1 hypothetical protein KMAL_05780 [Novacetimonas maltaceti]PYD61837.1 hypothetical protein CFR73_02085 [Novacetimonas maltaceti]
MTESNFFTRAGDFLTGATGDQSGLITVLNEILGPITRKDQPTRLEARSRTPEIMDMVSHWQVQDRPGPTTEAVIHALFSPEEIRRFSDETGLSAPAAMEILKDIVPLCARDRKKRQLRAPDEVR